MLLKVIITYYIPTIMIKTIHIENDFEFQRFSIVLLYSYTRIVCRMTYRIFFCVRPSNFLYISLLPTLLSVVYNGGYTTYTDHFLVFFMFFWRLSKIQNKYLQSSPSNRVYSLQNLRLHLLPLTNKSIGSVETYLVIHSFFLSFILSR